MKKAYAASLRVATALAGLLLVLISAQDIVTFIAKAQWCPVPPRYSSTSGKENWKWAKEATVGVTISTDFTATERQAIQDAFNDWNNHRWLNCSLVTFNGFQQGPRPPSFINNVVYVEYNDAERSNGGTAFMLTGVATQAHIVISGI